jgi:hypothetical protein
MGRKPPGSFRLNHQEWTPIACHVREIGKSTWNKEKKRKKLPFIHYHFIM